MTTPNNNKFLYIPNDTNLIDLYDDCIDTKQTIYLRQNFLIKCFVKQYAEAANRINQYPLISIDTLITFIHYFTKDHNGIKNDVNFANCVPSIDKGLFIIDKNIIETHQKTILEFHLIFKVLNKMFNSSNLHFDIFNYSQVLTYLKPYSTNSLQENNYRNSAMYHKMITSKEIVITDFLHPRYNNKKCISIMQDILSERYCKKLKTHYLMYNNSSLNQDDFLAALKRIEKVYDYDIYNEIFDNSNFLQYS